MPDYESYHETGTSSQVFKLLGITAMAGVTPIGPSIFMVRCILVGSASATIAGLTSAMICGLTIGTAALPFVIGSAAGFAIGLARWYSMVTGEAMIALDAYPELLRAHLIRNYPHHRAFRESPLSYFHSSVLGTNWKLRSMLVTGWLSTLPALEELRQRQEAALVAKYEEQNNQMITRMDDEKRL